MGWGQRCVTRQGEAEGDRAASGERLTSPRGSGSPGGLACLGVGWGVLRCKKDADRGGSTSRGKGLWRGRSRMLEEGGSSSLRAWATSWGKGCLTGENSAAEGEVTVAQVASLERGRISGAPPPSSVHLWPDLAGPLSPCCFPESTVFQPSPVPARKSPLLPLQCRVSCTAHPPPAFWVDRSRDAGRIHGFPALERLCVRLHLLPAELSGFIPPALALQTLDWIFFPLN